MMWMMGCNDGGGDFDTIQDPFTGRKLRPLMPRPAATAAAATTPPCFARIHGTDLLALNHHLAAMAEQNKRELNTQQVVVSSRWNPTPEQLQTLEELYRRGTRTPSAEQIQQITAQLRRYGKIEGKNVFYWFQNHKARERQKRRRHLESLCDEHQPPHHNNNNNIQINNETAQKRQEPAAGGNRTAFEVEQTKNWASLTNSSTTYPEKSGERAAECKLGSDGWVQFEEEDENDDPDETQQRRNATWQMMHLSCSSSSSPTTLINSSLTSSSAAAMEMHHHHHHHHPDFINIFFDPYTNPHQNNLARSGGGGGGGGGGVEETQTLQLFPLQRGGGGGGGGQEEEEGAAGVNSVTPPYKFFEFLPVKN